MRTLHTVFYSRLSDPAQITSLVALESKRKTVSTINVPLTLNERLRQDQQGLSELKIRTAIDSISLLA